VKRMVFDVESVGLHGEGFAVGWVLLDGSDYDGCGWVSCPIEMVEGPAEGLEWVNKHVPEEVRQGTDRPMVTPGDVRASFWGNWEIYRDEGYTLWADCSWPVEARFLADCVDDAHDERVPEGPYPLHEIATVLQLAGMDPLATYDRLENELPVHHPLMDATQSARLLIEALDKLGIEP